MPLTPRQRRVDKYVDQEMRRIAKRRKELLAKYGALLLATADNALLQLEQDGVYIDGSPSLSQLRDVIATIREEK